MVANSLLFELLVSLLLLLEIITGFCGLFTLNLVFGLKGDDPPLPTLGDGYSSLSLSARVGIFDQLNYD